MLRDLEQLSSRRFDLLVVGAGINGACIAWDATLRGLSVALVDKGDFGAATSAATGKMIHGGIRYLQHLAVGRVRASLRERRVLMQIAPHLVQRVPFIIPTYGHGLKGKEILTLGMILYDLLGKTEGMDDPRTSFPAHQRLSRSETLTTEPLLLKEGLTGAVQFYECQMSIPERLTLAFVLSAQSKGAVTVNYLKTGSLVVKNGRVFGSNLVDMMTGQEIMIEAKAVVNAAGPWVNNLLMSSGLGSKNNRTDKILSKGIHIVTRSLTNGSALALATKNKHSKVWFHRGGRHFFIVPWHGLSLIGTTNTIFNGDLEANLVMERDIIELIHDVNSVYPAAGLCRNDVRYFYGGLYPDDPDSQSVNAYQGARKDVIIDHEKSNGVNGLISVIGVKYTTARRLAEKVVDMILENNNLRGAPCKTECTALIGGELEDPKKYLQHEIQQHRHMLPEDIITHLFQSYGTQCAFVMRLCADNPILAERVVSGHPTIKAQVVHAVQEEMALTLQDVALRRTVFGMLGHPGTKTLRTCAMIMAETLGWNDSRLQQEILQVEKCYLPA